MSSSEFVYRERAKRLAEFCRTGKSSPLPREDVYRLNQYFRLVRGVFDDTLQTSFPLTYHLLTDESWNDLVDTFCRIHKAKTPEVWKMPWEFCQFVRNKDLPIKVKYPFLDDLLLFEWTEVEVYMMQDEKKPPYVEHGEWKKEPIVINPEIRVLGLTYPVYIKKAQDIKSTDAGNYYVSLHRHPKELSVWFTNLLPVHVFWIESLSEKAINFSDLITKARITFSGYTEEQFLRELEDFLDVGIKKRLILGTSV